MWFPTTTGELDPGQWELLSRLNGVADGRAFLGEAAVGLALDAAWRHGPRFVQTQVGVAMVVDNGPQLDSVFAAIGVGKQISRCTSLLAEWRFEIHAPGEIIHGPGLGVGRGDLTGSRWRFRFHPIFSPGQGELANLRVGLAVGIDFAHRFN